MSKKTPNYTTTNYCTPDLFKMLTYTRPHDSLQEKLFIERFILPLNVEEDDFGNLTKRIGNSQIMWSCHTDTVHHRSEPYQQLSHSNGYIGLTTRTSGMCLGADDGAGIWLMCELIKAQKPGLYVFHRAEEHGGKGSKWRSENIGAPNIKYCIALDRKGYIDIITHQSGRRCCSDEFANSLIKELDLDGKFKYKKDPTGSFTDSANYTSIIPECTNISVGYDNAHSPAEILDVVYLNALYYRLLSLNENNLVCKRDPKEPDYTSFYSSKWTSPYNYNKYAKEVFDEVLDDHPIKSKTLENKSKTLENCIRTYPDVICNLLDKHGISAETVYTAIKAAGFNLKGV